MSGIDASVKINSQRPLSSHQQALRIAVESDRARIINSAAVRRLQQKTQVFPLERNAAVRSRLTHSLEVQQVGRYIVQQVFFWLQRSDRQDYSDFQKIEREFESIVEMACLMHDIGNPPFGHFGEKAINDWFASHIRDVFGLASQGAVPDTLQPVFRDITHFEGNAQAIRLIASLLHLNLTYTQTASVLKYTRGAFEPKPAKTDPFYNLQKKPGYYLAEAQFVDALRDHLGMQKGARHPVSYIMEAADDISYCFADIEDAVEKGILTVPGFESLIIDAYQKEGGEPEKPDLTKFGQPVSFREVLDNALQAYNNEPVDSNNHFFINLRVGLHHLLVPYVARKFVENIDDIFDGTFGRAILEDDSPFHKLTSAFKRVAFEHVFCHQEVETQEIRGHKIIHGLLDYYRPLLMLGRTDFAGLLQKDMDICKAFPLESRLANKLPSRHRRAYEQGVKSSLKLVTDDAVVERYYRCRLIQDYISGMTDQHAFDEYKCLTVKD